MYQPSPGACSLLYKKRPQSAQLIWTWSNLCLLPVPSVRLNKISSMVPDEPDLLRHVTQLDIRDNRLTDLDASVFPRLEVLHCERNRIASLRAKGYLLKGIYASNNGGFLAYGTSCSWRRQSSVVRKDWSPSLSHQHHLTGKAQITIVNPWWEALFWTCNIHISSSAPHSMHSVFSPATHCHCFSPWSASTLSSPLGLSQ